MFNFLPYVEFLILIFAALSFFKEPNMIRLSGSYRNQIIKQILKTVEKESIWRRIYKNLGLTDWKQISLAFSFLIIEIVLTLTGFVMIFFLLVIAIPVFAVWYNLKLTRKGSFDFLAIIFKEKGEFKKNEKWHMKVYGLATYILIANMTFFLLLAFYANSFPGELETYLIGIILLLIFPELFSLFIMQHFLKFDYDNVIKRLLKLYKITVTLWIGKTPSAILSFEGEVISLYPHLKIVTSDGKSTTIVRWKDVSLLSYGVSKKLENGNFKISENLT